MEELTGNIIGLAMKVHRTLGPGFLELVYNNALTHELRKNGFKVEKEKAIAVRYDGIVVGNYVADLLVNQELLIEIKAMSSLNSAHEVQTVNYLTATNMDYALLLNFGSPSLQFKKKFRTRKETPSLS